MRSQLDPMLLTRPHPNNRAVSRTRSKTGRPQRENRKPINRSVLDDGDGDDNTVTPEPVLNVYALVNDLTVLPVLRKAAEAIR